MRHIRFLTLILVCLLLFYCRSLLGTETFRSDDLELHGGRLANFYLSIKQGQLPPFWAPNLNYGFGYPSLIVSYFLPYAIGVVWYVFGAGIEVSLNLTIIVSVVAGAFGFFILGKLRHLPEKGMTAGLLYVTAPYIMATIFIRGALGEITFFGLLPWVFVAIESLCLVKFRPWANYFAIIIFSLFLLTHPPSVLVSLPVIIGYVLLLNKKANHDFPKRSLLAVVFTSLLLVQFFWTPFLVEKNFVLAGSGFSTNDYYLRFPEFKDIIWSNWSMAGYDNTQSNHFTYRIGLIFWLIVVALIVFPRSNVLPDKHRYWRLVFFAGVFMLTSISRPIWDIFWPIQSVQFPWRLLWVPIFAGCMLYLDTDWYKFFGRHQQLFLTIAIISTITHHLIFYAKPSGYISNTNHDWLEYPLTTDSNGEFKPVRFDSHKNLNLNESLVGRLHQLPFYVKGLPTGQAKIEFQINAWTGSQMIYAVSTESDIDIIQKTAYFPGWQVIVDGHETAINFRDAEFPGRIIFPMKQGSHEVKVVFSGNTWDRKLGYSLSILGIITFLVKISIDLKSKKYQKIS